MNLSVNGQSQVPPGFRFHPTEEELLQYYLKKKVGNQKIDLDVIQEIDLNKLEPWDIQEKCRIGSAPQNDWYFFSHKDKKYPTGTRTNRATAAGFWKATGRDKVICSSSRRIGMRKTLVFYKGRAPHGEKSDWIMHEYRLDDITLDPHNVSDLDGDQSAAAEEGWVVCRVFKKKNYIKASDGGPTARVSTMDHQKSRILRSTTPDLDHILSYMENSSKEKNQTGCTGLDQVVQDRFMHLPQLDSPTDQLRQVANEPVPFSTNWAELDRLVAYQLNGHTANEPNDDTTTPFWLAGDPDGSGSYLRPHQAAQVYDSEAGEDHDQFWSFTKQSYSPTALNWNQTQQL